MTRIQDDFNKLEENIIQCKECSRLVGWREQVGRIKRKTYRDQEYWAKPVPGFGDVNAKLLVVGLAPGAHGSNRTGRMFTGDHSGTFLYPALWRAGFTNQAEAFNLEDRLTLNKIWITAVCRCVPPDNKPTTSEILNCRKFLLYEIHLMNNLQGIVALGKIAYDELIKIFQIPRIKSLPFQHGGIIEADEGKPWILASYHPSQQNTQTGRLTEAMFDQIWKKANQLLF